MKEESWVMIAAALMPIVWETLRTWYKNRRGPAKANQEIKKPQSWRGWIKSWLYSRLTSYLMSVASILLNAIFLINELSKTTPITPQTTFNISLYMGGIFFQLVVIVIYSLLYLADQKDKIVMDILYKHNETINGMKQLQERFLSLASDQVSAIEKFSTISGLPIEVNKAETDRKEQSIC